MISRRAGLLLAACCLLLYLPGALLLPPIDRDESRYAQASAQMLASGDLVDIRFLDEPRYKKPAGIYWLQSASAAIFGESSIFSYRLPSLLTMIASVWLLAASFARLYGPRASIIAALLMALAPAALFEAQNAKTDAALLLCTIVCYAALCRLWLERSISARWRAAFWAALGAAILIKGPVVPMVLAATLASLCLLSRGLGWLRSLFSGPALLLTLLLVLPWFVAIGIVSDGDFYRAALGGDFAAKAVSGQESHGGPPGYHALMLLFVFFPGAIFLPRAVEFALERRGDPSIAFLVAWFLPGYVIFELTPTKLPHYTLLLMPALALLIGIIAGFGLTERSRVARWVAAPWRVLWSIMAIALALLPAVVAELYQSPWQNSYLLVAIGFLAAARVVATAREPGARLLPLLILATPLFAWHYLSVFTQAVPHAQALRLSPNIASHVRSYACPEGEIPILYAVDYREPSMVFLLAGRVTMATEAEALAAVQNRSCALALVDADRRAAIEGGRVIAEITGFNYSKGDWLDLHLLGAAP